MWVRLQSIQQIQQNGRPVPHYPGEWVEVGKQQGLGWISTGEADRPDMPGMSVLPGCGLVVRGPLGPAQTVFRSLDITEGEPSLAFERTLFWNTSVKFRPELAVTGFRFLERWEIALPLLDYDTLARDLVSQAEAGEVEAVLKCLRVLVYEPRLMFLRRCPAARRLLEAWQERRRRFADDHIAFLVALYEVKPLVLALPASWIMR